MKDIRVIAVDADDTLWDNQSYYDRVGDFFADTLREYGHSDWLQDRLFETEMANMPLLGYGAKSVCISMMESAMEISGGKVGVAQLRDILKTAKSLLEIPATPLPGVRETLEKLRTSGRYRLILFTKGDLLDQQHKITRSGLAHFFDKTLIVSDKGRDEYLALCESEGILPAQLMMIGNSFKSDIRPVVELGGSGIHIPFHTIWKHEETEEFDSPDIVRLERFSDIIEVLLKSQET